jgi:hypothetical protein
MKSLMKPLTVAALGLALMVPTFDDASAQRRGRYIAGGIAAGVIAGAIIAGASSSARASPTYYARDCRDLRRQAIWNEERGRPGRAQYYWDRYSECRGE